MKIVTISDTHGLQGDLTIPDGDILIHAGDLTKRGDLRELSAVNEFFGQLPHPHKVVIAGNHDFCFERTPDASRAVMTNCTYLQDEAVIIEGIRLWGSPWQPWFYDWAFNLRRGPALERKWNLIPNDTDILITHGPPSGYGDTTVNGEAVGCADLSNALTRVQPKLHVFGHIHEGYGRWNDDTTTYINASICDYHYRPVNPPQVLQW